MSSGSGGHAQSVASAASSAVRGRPKGGRWHSMECPALSEKVKELDHQWVYMTGPARNPETADEVFDERKSYMEDIQKPDYGVARPVDFEGAQKEGQIEVLGQAAANAFKIEGDLIEKLELHAWEVRFSDPAIPKTDRTMRGKCFQGGAHKESFRKRDYWSGIFGKFSWSFDTQILWTANPDKQGRNEISVAKGEIGNDSAITLVYKGSNPVHAIPKAEGERMLNLLVVRKFMEQNYKDVFTPGGVKWFPKNDPKVDYISKFANEPGLAVYYGWQLRVNASLGKDAAVVFNLKIEQANRLQLSDSLYTQIAKLKQKCDNSGLNIDHELIERYMGRKAYTTYAGQRSVVIGNIFMEKDENMLMDGTNKTLKQYYKEKYGINLQFHQNCLVEQRSKPGTFFLPELLVLSAQSDDAPLNYGEALQLLSKPAYDRLAALPAFVKELNGAIANSDLNGKVSIKETPQCVDLIKLTNPTMFVKAKSGSGESSFNPADLPGAWGRNTGGPYTRPPKKKILVRHRIDNEFEAKNFVSYCLAYHKMRRLEEPEIFCKPWEAGMTFDRLKAYKSFATERHDIIVHVIPDGGAGSMAKALGSSALYHPDPGQDNPVGWGSAIQHILAQNCSNKSAVLGLMGNAYLKLGVQLYRLSLPQPDQLKEGDWSMGISVSHNGDKKPSIACWMMDMAPFKGSTKEWRTVALPIRPRQQTVPGRRTAQAMDKLLDLCRDAYPSKEEFAKALPQNLVIFRDGLADDQVTELLKEEMPGIKSAISKWTVRNKIQWQPRIVLLVVTKQSGEDFAPATFPQGRDGPAELKRAQISSPVMCTSGNILSAKSSEFLLQLNPKDRKARPRRYIVAHDSSRITQTTPGMKNLGNFILASTWSYAYALPFSTGNPGVPCPVKIASKYSELMSQFITNKDKKFDRFLTVNGANRPIIHGNEKLPHLNE